MGACGCIVYTCGEGGGAGSVSITLLLFTMRALASSGDCLDKGFILISTILHQKQNLRGCFLEAAVCLYHNSPETQRK